MAQKIRKTGFAKCIARIIVLILAAVIMAYGNAINRPQPRGPSMSMNRRTTSKSMPRVSLVILASVPTSAWTWIVR